MACKAGKNIISAIFKHYIKENSPELAVRYSLLPYKEQENMVNIPLYYVGKIKKIHSVSAGYEIRHVAPSMKKNNVKKINLMLKY